MVRLRLIDYTLVDLDGTTHLVDPYARETICGLEKKHKPTVWHSRALGTGCIDCQTIALARLSWDMAQEVSRFDQFVSGAA
jgi:hypothetical protein